MDDPHRPSSGLGEHVRRSARRRLQSSQEWSVWSGLGFMGMVGWSMALPVLFGAIVGGWLDRHWPVGISWTLWLILAGLVFGAWNTWRWIVQTGVMKNGDSPGEETRDD